MWDKKQLDANEDGMRRIGDLSDLSMMVTPKDVQPEMSHEGPVVYFGIEEGRLCDPVPNGKHHLRSKHSDHVLYSLCRMYHD